jgi:hypothetical protein
MYDAPLSEKMVECRKLRIADTNIIPFANFAGTYCIKRFIPALPIKGV